VVVVGRAPDGQTGGRSFSGGFDFAGIAPSSKRRSCGRQGLNDIGIRESRLICRMGLLFKPRAGRRSTIDRRRAARPAAPGDRPARNRGRRLAVFDSPDVVAMGRAAPVLSDYGIPRRPASNPLPPRLGRGGSCSSWGGSGPSPATEFFRQLGSRWQWGKGAVGTDVYKRQGAALKHPPPGVFRSRFSCSPAFPRTHVFLRSRSLFFSSFLPRPRLLNGGRDLHPRVLRPQVFPSGPPWEGLQAFTGPRRKPVGGPSGLSC